MADPETPTHGLAERLEADAERWDLDHCCSVDVADLRAAAAQLRQLDRVKAAYEAVKGEHLATSRPFRADCDNAECDQLVRHLAHELDALEADDGA